MTDIEIARAIVKKQRERVDEFREVFKERQKGWTKKRTDWKERAKKGGYI